MKGNEEDKKKFSRNLRELMKRRELTQGELARRISVAPSQITRWLSATTLPEDDSLFALSNLLLGSSPKDFLLSEIEFDNKYASSGIPCLDSNTEGYAKLILDRTREARHVKIAVLSPQEYIKDDNGPRELNDSAFRQRLVSNKIIYQAIEVFYSIRRFSKALQDAYAFSVAKQYKMRYFLAAPKPIPTINIRIIDNDVYLFGTFTSDSNGKQEAWQVDASHPFARVLDKYWDCLWAGSIGLTTADDMTIEAKKILATLGIVEESATRIIEKARAATQKKP